MAGGILIDQSKSNAVLDYVFAELDEEREQLYALAATLSDRVESKELFRLEFPTELRLLRLLEEKLSSRKMLDTAKNLLCAPQQSIKRASRRLP